MKHISDKTVLHEMSAEKEPVGTVQSGDTFVIKTRSPGIPDEIFQRDYSDGNYPARVLSISGPVFIQDAEPGDLLKITVHDIQFDTFGKMWMGQWMGILMDEVKKPYLRKVDIIDGAVQFSERVRIPLRPMIGTIGVAPSEGEVPCLYPGTHGGNMDVPSAAPGNIVYLPVLVKGALLAVGDVHAAMGDGEVLGTGVEIGSEVTLQVEVIKDRTITNPRIELPESMEFIASHKDIMEASKQVTRDAIHYITEHSEFTFDEAYALVGQTGNLKFAQVVNPIYTVTMQVPKYILEGN